MTKNLKANAPLWIAVIVAIPLIALFALSLFAAMAVASLVATVYMLFRPSSPPTVARRRPDNRNEIELDPRDYRRLPSGGRDDD